MRVVRYTKDERTGTYALVGCLAVCCWVRKTLVVEYVVYVKPFLFGAEPGEAVVVIMYRNTIVVEPVNAGNLESFVASAVE